MEDGAPVIVGCIKGHWSCRFGVSEHRDGGKKELGAAKSRVKHRGSRKRFYRALEGIGERS